jgi:hypothetical protein
MMSQVLGDLCESNGGQRGQNWLIRGAPVVVVVALWLAAPAPAQTTQTFDAFDRGWYDDSGFHDNPNKNTFTGQNGSGTEQFNSFFTFDLTGLTGVSSGTLRLELESYFGVDASEAFTVYDVVTDVSTLNASNFGRVDIFGDLESGSVYGTGTATPGDENTVLEIPLSNAAIDDINSAAGGLVAVAVHVDQITRVSGDEGLRWSSGFESRTHQLVLEAGCFVFEAVDDQFSVINNGASTEFAVLANDRCKSDRPISVVTLPGDLMPDRGGVAITDGTTVSYTPTAGFLGFEEFSYTAQDAGLDGGGDPPAVDQDTARVVINVLEDIAPDAVDDAVTTLQDQPIIIDVLENDSLGNSPSELAIESQPANGSLLLESDDTIRYSPSYNFFGEDSFEYRITDANGDSDIATVTVGVFFVRGVVPIDIMPNDAGNNINLVAGPGAGFNVAILSVGEFFDAPSQIDALTLKFGPRQANIWGIPRVRDSNGDGVDDLVVRFLTQQTGIACGDTSASLSGRTVNSQSISGLDAVNTFNCPRVRKRH